MKYILLLSFLLAFLPGQNVQRLHVDQTPDFVAFLDQMQALPATDNKSGKKFQNQIDELFLPPADLQITDGKCPLLPNLKAPICGQMFTAPYAIRGPPATV